MMHGTVESRGCRLHYRLSGDGPPLVFIQGAGIHASGCDPQVAELRHQFRCLTFDNRGVGESQPIGARITVDQMVECIEKVTAEEIQQISQDLFGHNQVGLSVLGKLNGLVVNPEELVC